MEARAQRAEQLVLEIRETKARLQTERTTLQRQQEELGEIRRLQEVEARAAKWEEALAAHGRPLDWAKLLEDLLPTVMEVWQAAGQKAWGEPKNGLGFSKAMAVVREVCAGWKEVHDAEVTRLVFNRQMNDEAMGMLVPRFQAVVSVEFKVVLGGYGHLVTDGGVSEVCSRLPALTTLNLNLCRQVTDVGAAAVSGLPALTSLSLGSCLELTDVGVQAVSSMTALTSLDLYICTRNHGRGRARSQQPARFSPT